MKLIDLLRLIIETMQENSHLGDEEDYGTERAWSDAYGELSAALSSCACESGLRAVAELHIPVKEST